MNNTMLMEIDQTAVNNPENIEALIEAAGDILNTTSVSFEEMKKKKWYKRLWGMITFSKDNEKRLAKGVGSLAQIQDIVIKMLLILSHENTKIAGLVSKNTENIERLAVNVLHLSDEIELIKEELHRNVFFFDRIKLSELSASDKKIILCGMTKYYLSYDNPEAFPLAQEYLVNFRKALGIAEQPNADMFNYENIGDLSGAKSNELYFMIISEITMLLEAAFDNNNNFDNAIENVSISPKKKKEILDRISKTVKLENKQGIAKGYYEPDTNALSIINIDGIEFGESGLMDSSLENNFITEKIVISSLVHIPEGKELTYKNKEIKLCADIQCEGKLTLDNCKISYDCRTYTYEESSFEEDEDEDEEDEDTDDEDEDTIQGKIVISRNASVNILRCEIWGFGGDYLSDKIDSSFNFIKGKDDSSYLMIENTKFFGCPNFASDVKIEIKSSSFWWRKFPRKDLYFVKAVTNSNSSMSNCLMENDDRTFEFKNLGETVVFKRSIRSYLDYINYMVDFSIKHPDGNLDGMEKGKEFVAFRENIENYIDGIFINISNISNCTFKNMPSCISNASKIDKCLFDGCRKVINTDGYSEVSDCLFIYCENIISGLGGNIKRNKFLKCYNAIFDIEDCFNSKKETVDIEYCEFYNIFSLETGIKIERNHGDPSKGAGLVSAHLNNCSFNGIQTFDTKGFISCTIIKMDKMTKDKNAIGINIENCNFKNCKTYESAKIINTENIAINNCKGLQSINKEKDKAENISIKQETSMGEPIGAKLNEKMIGWSGYRFASNWVSIEGKKAPIENASFSMTIVNFYESRGIDTCIIGEITKGKVSINDTIYIVNSENKMLETIVFNVNTDCEDWGDNAIGIYLKGINRDELKEGYIVVKF